MIRIVALASLALFASEAYAQEAPSPDLPENTPWGYVYVFRSQHAYPLEGDDVRLGRLPENQITLTSARVSRRHAAIRRTDNGVELVDVGSSNGSRLNGRELRARVPLLLHPGDRIQLADELLLFDTSLEGLWTQELRLRLLSTMIRMNAYLPQDFTRKSLGREEIVPVTSEAVISLEQGTMELSHSVEKDPNTGFFHEIAAFVGNVILDDGELELSLWAIEGGGSMTSRRSSISRLKHTTVTVAVDTTGYVVNPLAPWFPQEHLSPLFDVFTDDRDTSLRFATSLAAQDRPVALRDASETLAFRHELSGKPEWELLVASAKAGGAWVEGEVLARRMKLTQIERDELSRALEINRRRLENALSLGAKGQPVEEAGAVIDRAEKRLAALEER